MVIFCDKTVMFFCGNTCHGLEPVGKMSCAALDSPALHSLGNCVCYAYVKRTAIVDGALHSIVYVLRQAGFHRAVVKYHRAENFGKLHYFSPFK